MRDPSRVDAVHPSGLRDGATDPGLDRLTRLAAFVCRAPSAWCGLFEAERVFLKGAFGLPVRASDGMALSPALTAVLSGASAVVVEEAGQAGHAGDPGAEALGMRAWVAVPLVGPSGHTIGSFCVYDTRPRRWTADEVQAVEDLAASALTELELRASAQEAEAARRDRWRRHELETSQKQVLEQIARDAPLPQTLQAIVSMVEERSTDGVLAGVLLLDRERRVLREGAAGRLPEPLHRAMSGLAANAETSPFGAAVAAGATIDLSDLSRETTRWPGFRSLALECGLRACSCVPLVGGGGEALGVLSLFYRTPRSPSERDLELVEDVAPTAVVAIERAQAAQERARLLEQIQEKDRLKDEFLATLAHELRNPLGPIRTGLELMRLRSDDPAALESVRAIIERQSRSLVRLVDDLLDVSRITLGKIALRKERVDAATLLEQAAETTRPLIEARGHELRLSLPRKAIPLMADPVRLEQVLSNLLSNAAKYTEKGGRIEASVAAEDDEVVYRVRDTGIGIAPELLPRIFEPFVQAERSPARAQGGLGLGLALVRSLVQMHGGSVEAHSGGLGQGAELVVRLPAWMSQIDSAAEAPAPPPIPSTQARRRRVLVVDDNLDAAESLATFLAAYGHTVRVAHDGPTAIAEAVRYRPEFVLLDIGLPRMDGYEVAQRLRAEPELANATIYALTGYGQDADRSRSMEAGFDDHLVKPVDPMLLRALLERP